MMNNTLTMFALMGTNTGYSDILSPLSFSCQKIEVLHFHIIAIIFDSANDLFSIFTENPMSNSVWLVLSFYHIVEMINLIYATLTRTMNHAFLATPVSFVNLRLLP